MRKQAGFGKTAENLELCTPLRAVNVAKAAEWAYMVMCRHRQV